MNKGEIPRSDKIFQEALGEGEPIERVEKTKMIGREWHEGSSEINWDQICFIRAVGTFDQLKVKETREEKELEALSRITSTKGAIPRISVHWSLNHKVESHLYGSWLVSPAVIVSPGEATIERNGKPSSLTGFDTWWDKDVIIPKGSVIVCTIDQPKELEVPGIRWRKVEVGQERVRELYEKQAWRQRLYEELKIAEPGKGEELNREIYQLEQEIYKISSEIDETVRKAVDEEIRAMGYSVFKGGTKYMKDKGLDEATSRLARTEGISSGPHAYRPEGRLEEEIITLSSAKPEELFSPKEEGESETLFGALVSAIDATLQGVKKENEHLDPKYLQVGIAELYAVLRNNPQKVLQDSSGISALRKLFKNHPDIRRTICYYAEVEEPVKQLLEKIDLPKKRKKQK